MIFRSSAVTKHRENPLHLYGEGGGVQRGDEPAPGLAALDSWSPSCWKLLQRGHERQGGGVQAVGPGC